MDEKLSDVENKTLRRTFEALLLLEKYANAKDGKGVMRVKHLFSTFDIVFREVQEYSVQEKIDLARNEFLSSIDDLFDEKGQKEALVRGKFLVKEIKDELKKMGVLK